MGFVPVTGTALLRVGDPPREGVVEFSDERRTVALPIRAALPVLTKAHPRDDLHPSVRLLTSAALLGLRLVAAGRLEPAAGQVPHWRAGPLGREDEDRVRSLVGDGVDDEVTVRAMLDAIADAMPRAAPTPSARRRTPAPASFHERLARRLEPRPDAGDLPQLVRISLRVEADEEELVAGSVRLVLQVHDEQDPLHLCDAAVLWTESGPEASHGSGHGFGDRARTHAAIALRAAAEAWPVLDRLAELRVPDQITLDTDELVSLLNEGVADLAASGVDVLWPRSLGRDLTATAVLERASVAPSDNALETGLFGPDQMFSFQWQVALHGETLTEEEMTQLARAAAPILKLRGSWTVIDPAVARKARKRLIRTVAPGPAVAAALTGTVEVGQGDDAVAEQVVVGASLLDVRERLLGAATRDPVEPPAALAGTLRDYQRQGLSWLVEMTSLGLGACLADDMGLGKTITLIALHLHRQQSGHPGPTLVVCPASLLGNWEAEIARFAPGVPVRRFHGGRRTLDAVADGFVLTTYGTMRVSAEDLAAVRWGLVVADEAQHIKNARSSTARALRAIPHGARIAMTGTPVENNLTELWAILDWSTPGLLGSRLAFRKRWAAQVESGVDPAVTRQFTELISPFVLRRRKSDPGIAPELPAKTETDHPLGLTREQTVLYEAFVKDTMERIERADPADQVTRRGLVLALLTGLKQICNHPAHFLKQSGAVRLSGRSEKLDLIDELLGTVLAEDGAALVFTQYVAMGRLLSAHLAKGGLEHRFLHGGTPIRERESMVASFQAGDFPVFLLSLKAGGTGLNLTGADHVIHVDRWWNPAVEEQATDRAYRIGQTKPVQVHRLVTRGTIEEKIAGLLTRKRALADAVLGSGEAALTELSDDELRDLVTLRRDEDRRHGWDRP
ncbi:DEAD/DEAH box helicase [Nocardioides sp.]|uniref:DEAD/DEAH box helicase n=1 Tax=Nocardioides sp. TaxID=35761 RepID=UPI001A2720D9|nr:DEAD/DEAH box helicase [Nocardioides sp.]MBJ7358947.1 DEAD/DEAH box helicase [Nocardioides sp.]